MAVNVQNGKIRMAETTHLICAHCGTDHSISNALNPTGNPTGILTLRDEILTFTCPKCAVEYKIPILINNSHYPRNNLK
jgi:RNase P subunit RPR2